MDIRIPAESPGIIRVLEGIKPVFATNKATVLEFYDRTGNLMALFFKQFDEDMWVFTTKGDDDWESNLIRLGYITPSISAKTLARVQGLKG